MPSKGRKIKSRKTRHIILILFLAAAAVFFLYKEAHKEPPNPEHPKHVKHEKQPEILPRVAIVIDDLGPNKKKALGILNIKSSLTLSVFPGETYSGWIAEEGRKRGYDIIGHIPMEAKAPHSLGKGGLYTWMTTDEIRETLESDLNSIPRIKAISNHMGSAFTEDERAMDVIMSVIYEHKLFFLDSLTSSNSLGEKLAKKHRVKIIKRDLFLDDTDSPQYISASWKKLVAIAKKNGYAVALAHPRDNTIRFLSQALPSDEVTVVPLSRLVD